MSYVNLKNDLDFLERFRAATGLGKNDCASSGEEEEAVTPTPEWAMRYVHCSIGPLSLAKARMWFCKKCDDDENDDNDDNDGQFVSFYRQMFKESLNSRPTTSTRDLRG